MMMWRHERKTFMKIITKSPQFYSCWFIRWNTCWVPEIERFSSKMKSTEIWTRESLNKIVLRFFHREDFPDFRFIIWIHIDLNHRFMQNLQKHPMTEKHRPFLWKVQFHLTPLSSDIRIYETKQLFFSRFRVHKYPLLVHNF